MRSFVSTASCPTLLYGVCDGLVSMYTVHTGTVALQLTGTRPWLHPVLAVAQAQEGIVFFGEHKAVSCLEFLIAPVATQATCMECLHDQKVHRWH